MYFFSFRILICFNILILFSLLGYSQQYNFRNYSIAEGLAQSQVYSICEDSFGNIWSGTRGGGVSRFDGITFTNYTEEDGLVNNYIRSIIKDHNGNLWFGTDKGLSKYDGKKFYNYSEKQGLFNVVVNDLIEDKKGIIWIATDKGIFHFDKDTIFRFGRKLKLPLEKVNCLHEDGKGSVWAGTDFGVYKFDNKSGDSKYKFYTRKDGLPLNIITSIKDDGLNNIWITTYGGGVSRLDAKNIFANFNMNDGLASNTVLCCGSEGNGTMWFGTVNGVTKINFRDSVPEIMTYTQTEGLPNNVVMAVIKDSFGNMWFGTSGGGIGKLGGERFIHYKAIKGVFGGWVYSIFQDKKEQMWFGTSEGGVTKYDGKYYKRFSEKDGFTAAKIKCIHEDVKGNLWFGTIGDGIYLFDGSHFRHFGIKNGLSSNFVNYIISDSLGNLYLATAGGGISLMESSGTQYLIKKIGKKDGLMDDRVNALLLDRKGTIWAGTTEGIYKIIPAKDTISMKIINFSKQSGMISYNTRSIVEFESRFKVFGTAGGGIIMYHEVDSPKDNPFFVLNKSKGLASNNIYSLIVDNSGILWAGSEKGIDKFYMGQVKHYGQAEGFLGIETIQNSVCKDKDGNLWFGTVDRATKYIPSNEHWFKVPPKIEITGMRLFFNRIENTIYSDSIKSWYPVPVYLNLPYDQNHLSFEFAGIDLTNPAAIRYSYLLEGFDEAWSPYSEKREAVYSNLSPGEYIFKVLARNEDGLNSRIAIFKFKILPPFWGTWWFRIFSVFTAGLFFGLIYSFRVRNLKRKNEVERQRLTMERDLLELEQKALRLQMNPHFLFNCLNSIKGLISENKQEEAKIYLSKFSKLMRSMLDNSMRSFVALHEEISGLKNYGELEKLSREDKFEFYIESDSSIEAEGTEIPPMLIQPFVENAILHGLAPKRDKGWVKVKLSLDGNYIKCIIEDNGIGRAKAAELKSKSIQEYKSAAIAVTQERLNILNKKLNFTEVKIAISDLYDENSLPSGTRVELYIPYIKI